MSAALLASPLAGSVLAAGGEAKKSGPLGLVVILVLCVACYFLFKSMSTHLKRVREEFPSDLPPEPGRATDLPGQQPEADGADDADGAGGADRAGGERPAAPRRNGDQPTP